MISWIVASNDRLILAENLLAGLEPLPDGDELVIVEDAPSIAVAYNEGGRRATQPIRCYVHHDVQILDLQVLRAGLIRHCGADVGMVGVVGSRNTTLPWWDGDLCGGVDDARPGIGPLDFGPGGPVAYLDGLLLASAQPLQWDETYPGWHLYDYDMCRQMSARGLANWCLDGGRHLVRHNTRSAKNVGRLQHWDTNLAAFRRKWDE